MLPACVSSVQARFLGLLLPAVLPGVGLMCYLGVQQRVQALASAQEDSLQLVRVMAANQARLIEAEEHLLAAIAQLPGVLRGETVACHARFAELLQRYPRYLNLTAEGAVDQGTTFYFTLGQSASET